MLPFEIFILSYYAFTEQEIRKWGIETRHFAEVNGSIIEMATHKPEETNSDVSPPSW